MLELPDNRQLLPPAESDPEISLDPLHSLRPVGPDSLRMDRRHGQRRGSVLRNMQERLKPVRGVGQMRFPGQFRTNLTATKLHGHP